MERKLPLGFRLLVGLAGAVAPWILRLWYSTCRIVHLNPEFERNVVRRGVFVAAAFHKHFLFHSYYNSRRRYVIMVSRSKDGEIVSRVLRRLGFVTVRGSSSRGGREALEELIELGRRGYFTSLLADGPKGPPRVPKMGAIVAAKETGRPVIPFAVAAEKTWDLRSWDRSAIPYPFSRIAVKWGTPMPVPPDASREDCERYRRRLQDALIGLEEEVRVRLERGG